jgi:peptide-methionine (S)-S-oxide reductase
MKKLFPFILLLIPSSLWADEALFAGGCFWCMESAYQELEGVTDVVSGFAGGELESPSYKGDHSGHYEAVIVSYDATVISYRDLLDIYWVNIDPFDDGGQFCDRGFSYRAALFPADESQRRLAESSLADISTKFPDRQVVTQILPASHLWPVAESHQDYYQKNPLRYRYYRYGCGRDARLQTIWGQDATH